MTVSNGLQLDGPRLEPASGKPPRQLVILIHGFGADGHDLIGLGQQWRSALPDALFVSPHGPEPCIMSPTGRQWFAITRLDPDEFWEGCLAAAPALERFIADELAANALDETVLALVGFSQGAMLALHVGLRMAGQPAALLGYSGGLAGPDHLAGEIKSKPPVLLVHGGQDEVVPVAALSLAQDALQSAGVSVNTHISPGLGHGIDPEGLALGGRFLVEHLPGAP